MLTDMGNETPDESAAPAPESSSRWAWPPFGLTKGQTNTVAIVVASTLLVGVVLGSVIGIAATTPATAAHEARADDLQAELAAAEGQISEAEDAKDRAEKTAQAARERMSTLQSTLESRETEVTTAEAALAEREAAVKAREDAASANADAVDWWIDEVQECLARPGSYRMATVTEGSIGPDTSCMSG
jgi:septal ring factor EnvC (AmiA/AmiB activator)